MTQELFDSYRDIVDRVPLSVLQGVFKEHGLLAGRSSESTFQKVEEMLAGDKQNELVALQRIAEWYFDDYMLHGEKAVFFYQIPEEGIASLIADLLLHIPTDNINPTMIYPTLQ